MTTDLQSVPQPSLHRKLAEVMAEVSRVPKRGRNEFHKYDYATEADIVEAVRGALSSRLVSLLPEVMDTARDGTLTTVKMAFTFVDGETGEKWRCNWAGSGDDKGDKGLYKAMTGALKYFLLKTFLMPTGDDPEADADTDKRAETTKRGPERHAGGGARSSVGRAPTNAGSAPASSGEAAGSSPAAPSGPKPPHYWKSRTHALMADIGYDMGDKGKSERRRTYSLALNRAIVTDEQSAALSEDEWRTVGKYVRDKNSPPGPA